MNTDIPIKLSLQKVINYPFDYLNDQLRIFWVLKGSLQIKFVSGIIELNASDTEVVNLSEPVGLQGTDDNLVAIFSINGAFVQSHFPGIDKLNLSCNFNYIFPRTFVGREKEDFIRLLSEMVSLYFATNVNKTAIEQGCITILQYLTDHFNSVVNILSGVPNAEYHISRFKNINDFIQDNLEKKLTLSDMASREFLSVQYLAGEFKNRYGITFNEILNYYRVIHSVQLLLSTDLTITDISGRCGFSATRYYYKYFKKYLFLSPHEFRKRNQKHDHAFYEYEEVDAEKIVEVFAAFSHPPKTEAPPRPIKKVLLLNPNTSVKATSRIEKIARAAFSPDILVKTLSVPFGPDVLRTHLDETISELAVMETLLTHRDNYDGAIIACFSDVGVKVAKKFFSVPIISIAEAAYYSACLLGEHFSVITSGGDLERRLIGATIERCGLTSKCLSIKSLYIDFLNIDRETTMAPLERLVLECKEKDGADVVVLGCVSLAGMGEEISERLKIPVIDGVTQSALFMESMLHTSWIKLLRNNDTGTSSTVLSGNIHTEEIEQLYLK